jgi:hypothetical protein
VPWPPRQDAGDSYTVAQQKESKMMGMMLQSLLN